MPTLSMLKNALGHHATAPVLHVNDVIQPTTSDENLEEFNEGTIGNFLRLSPDKFLNLTVPNDTLVNGTFNNTFIGNEDGEPLAHILLMGVLSIVLGLMILVTIIGNVFVIAAILMERNLQNVANYLIVSLAVADLMVACLVMPLGAVYV
ncbi:PREDICTED: 5-hydroxytryptamine receptor-like, partial [Nicrophorus vespilloides]